MDFEVGPLPLILFKTWKILTFLWRQVLHHHYFSPGKLTHRSRPLAFLLSDIDSCFHSEMIKNNIYILNFVVLNFGEIKSKEDSSLKTLGIYWY